MCLDGRMAGSPGRVECWQVESPTREAGSHLWIDKAALAKMCSLCARFRPAHGLQVSHWGKEAERFQHFLSLPPETICRVFVITSVPLLRKMAPPELQITCADLIRSKWVLTIIAASLVRAEPAARLLGWWKFADASPKRSQ